MKKFPKFQSELEARTLALLDKLPRHVDLKDVATETGLSSSWLTQFATKQLTHPSVGRVEKLYNYLSPTPLFPK